MKVAGMFRNLALRYLHLGCRFARSRVTTEHRFNTRRRNIDTSNCYVHHCYGACRYAHSSRRGYKPYVLTDEQIGASIASSVCVVQGEFLFQLAWDRSNEDSPSSVQASFGFDFGARPAKQASLPPQLSARRTPARTTPRTANGSAKRHQSASVKRSSGSKRKSTSKDQTTTPQLGKRKRGSPNALPDVDDGEEDELSPDREDTVHSIEKSRRVVGTVSPIREELDEAPDELSVLESVYYTVRKGTPNKSPVLNGTPVSVLAEKRIFAGNTLKRTPIADRVGSVKAASRQSLTRRSGSREPDSATPSLLPNGRSRVSSASRLGPQAGTPNLQQPADESEDELSPPQANGSTPRIVATEQETAIDQQENTQLDADELSSPIQPAPAQDTPPVQKTSGAKELRHNQAEEQSATTEPKKRGRPRRIVLDEEDEAPSVPPPGKSARRDRTPKSVAGEMPTASSTPAVPIARGKSKSADTEIHEDVDDQLDELSPDKERTIEVTRSSTNRSRHVVEVSEAEEMNEDEDEDPQPEEESEPTPRPVAKRQSPKRQQHIKPTSEKPLRKRHKFLGPKHAISVMRIKGSTVRGITVADTTRTILEETIDHRLNRMATRMQTSKDSTQRKELRSEINMSLSFKESLNEKLLDLQDANDVLSTNFKKMKLFKRDNAELRKDILALQNKRQEIALEHDDVQAEFDAEKAKVDAANQLSEDMFAIEAAIKNGRKKARREGRETEGPAVPLGMLLGMVGENVGSFGGGLLSNIQNFNGALERAAGWLEGRA